MKAPATQTAKSGKPAASGAKARASVANKSATAAKTHKPAAKPPAKAVKKPVTKTTAKAPLKKTTKPTAKTVVMAKPAVKAPVKSAAKKSPAAKAPVAKPAARAPAKAAAAKAVVPSRAAKTPVKPVAPSASKVAAKPAAKAATAVPKAAPAAAPVSTPSSTRQPAALPPVVVEASPRPLGKRAAKKVMMEQMTQAAVVPTHAPDAAKATFSHMNQRAVMTPPVPSSIQKDPKRANNWKTLPVDQLTDLDIQAMPDSEYMSDLQLAYFRRKLSQLKADMLANAGETTEHLREDTVVVPDPADRATIEEEHALELRTRDRERKLLKKIEQAIARIDSGDYGYCEETGEPIGVGRLMARPTASLSLEAQQRRELKQKMFGD